MPLKIGRLLGSSNLTGSVPVEDILFRPWLTKYLATASILAELSPGQFLVAQYANIPFRGYLLPGRLSGIEPESKAPQTSVLTVTP